MSRSLTVKLLPILVVSIIVTGILMLAGSSAPQKPDKKTLIVKMAKGLSDLDARAIVNRHNGTSKGSIPKLDLQLIEVPAYAADAISRSLKGDAAVLRVEENLTRKWQSTPSDNMYPQQWALPRIGWDQVYGNVTPQFTTNVAILDTGVDGSHPDLIGSIGPGTSILPGSDPFIDANGHGTWLAGIIAAQTNNVQGVAGVAFDHVQVMPVKVLSDDGYGEDSDIIAGVIWAVDNGASVILMAFSNPGSSAALQEAVDYAWSHNVVLVAAIGNDGSNTATFPAGDQGVIGVSATDQNDQLASTSNYGSSVFVAAPGVDILSTYKDGGYVTWNGTSASAAMVAGTAALMRAVDPSLSNGVIAYRIAHSADPAGSSDQTGNGRLNIARSLADTSTDSIQPAGAAGGPLVGPYKVAANISGSLQGQNKTPCVSPSPCPWQTSNLTGWAELDTVPIRLLFAGGQNSANTTSFDIAIDHLGGGGTAGLESLKFLSKTSNVTMGAITFSKSPQGSGAEGWTYTFNVDLTDDNAGEIQFTTRLSAGAHNFSGASLQIKGAGTVSFIKPAAAPGSPNLSLNKTALSGVAPGQTMTYTLSYQNIAAGSGTTNRATGVQLTDVLPSAVTYVNGSCTGCVYDSLSKTLSWDLGIISAGSAVATKTYQVTVGSALTNGTPFSNNAKILSAEDDADLTNNSKTVTTTVFTPAISGTVFDDASGNGVVDSGEGGLAGATVTLYQDNGNGTFDGAPTDPQVGLPITTAAGGDWAFTSGLSRNLTYFVVRSNPAGYTSTGAIAEAVAVATDHSTATSVTNDRIKVTFDNVANVSQYSSNNQFLAKLLDTTTTTAINAATITYGANGTVTVTVSSASSTPTGNVTLAVDGGTPVSKALSSGSATFTSSDIPALSTPSASGSPHSLHAIYAAQNNFGASSGDGTLTVNPAVATVTFTAADKFYNTTNAATVSNCVIATGNLDGGNLTCTVASGTFASANASASAQTVSATATLGGSAAGNYTLSNPVTTTAKINPAPVTVTFTAADKFYNTTNAATVSNCVIATGNLDGGNLTCTVASGTFASANASASAQTVSATATLGGSAAGNYTLSNPVTTTAKINPAPVTVTFTAADKFYNTTNAATVSNCAIATGNLDGGNLTCTVATGTFASANASASAQTVSATATLGGSAAGNYTLSNPITTTAKINPAPVTVTFTAADKTYNGNDTAAVSNCSIATGNLDGGNLTCTVTSGTFASANASASAQTVSATATLGGSAAGNYTVSNPVTTTAKINPAPVTVTFTAADKTYNGNNTASVSNCSITTGKVGSDDVSCTVSAGTFASSNANANSQTVSATATLGGTTAGNYTLTNPVTTSAKINPAPVTVTFTAADRTYNGNNTASVSGCTIATGKVGTDDVTCSVSGGTFASSNANANPQTVSATATLGGSTAGNYTLTNPVTTSAKINPAPVTVTFTAADKTYNGNNTASVSGCTIATGKVGTDDVTCSVSGGTFASSNANANPQTVSATATLGGSTAGNYTLTNPVTTSAKINPAPVTVTFTAADKTYNGNNTASVSGCTIATGKVGTDDVTCSVSGGTFASSNANANSQTVSATATLGGTTASNYSVTNPVTSSAKINAAPVTVTFTAADKTYDGNNTASVSNCTIATGKVGDDDVSCTVSGGTFASSNANANPQTVSATAGLGGGSMSNYTVTNPVTAAAKINPAPITATAGGGQSNYDGTEKTPSPCVVSGAYTGGLTCSNSPATVGPNAGTSTIYASLASNSNFAITKKTGTYTIDKISAVASASDVVETYNGQTHVGNGQCTPAGLTLSITYSGGSAPINAGTTTFIATCGDGGVNYVNDSVTKQIKINPALITATAGGGQSDYDGNSKTPSACIVSGTYTGGLTCSNSPATVGPNAGTSTIYASIASNTNFTITKVSGTYAINKIGAQVAAIDVEETYNGQAHTGNGQCTPSGLTLAITYSGGSAPITVGTTDFTATCGDGGVNYTNAASTKHIKINAASVTATAGSGSSTYDVATHSPSGCVVSGGYTGSLTCSNSPASVGPAAGTSTIVPVPAGPAQSNFDIKLVNGSYVINPKQATATANSGGGLYKGAAYSGSGTCSDGLTPAITYTPGPSAPVNVSTTSFTVTCGDGGHNFINGTADGSITIDPATPTVNITWTGGVYTGYAWPATATVTGVGSPAQAIGSPAATFAYFSGPTAVGSPLGGAPVNVGTYTVRVSFGGNSNYTPTYADKTITITQAALMIKAKTNTKIWDGGMDAAAQPDVVGLKASDSVTGKAESYDNPNVATGHTMSVMPGFTVNDGNGGNNYSVSMATDLTGVIMKRPTTIVLDLSGFSGVNFSCVNNGLTATLTDTATGATLSNAAVTISVGSQSVSGLTDNSGKFYGTITLNQTPGTVAASASYAGTLTQAAAATSTNVTVLPDPNVGPLPNSALYTGSLFVWTTGPSSSTASLALSATIRDTSTSCNGDITKAKVTFAIRTNGSSSWNAISNAQNLPVGLVTPTDKKVGTASALAQYDIGKSTDITSIEIAVIVGGEYYLNSVAYDQIVTISKPGLVSSFTGGGSVQNAAFSVGTTSYPASSGYIGNAPADQSDPNYRTTFEADVKYNKSGTNPQGKMTVLVKSYNKPDGTVDVNPDGSKVVHTYVITSNAISELTMKGSNVVSFSSKVTVKDAATGTTIDSGNMLNVTLTDAINGGSDLVAIQVQKSTGGLWYSSSWGLDPSIINGGVPSTVQKPLASGNAQAYK